MLKTLRDIDKAIVMLDGNTTRMTTNRRRRAKHAWHAMFPSLDMEPVCLKGTDSSEEILTLQDDGSLLLDTLGDDMDQRLKEERAKKDKRRASKKGNSILKMSMYVYILVRINLFYHCSTIKRFCYVKLYLAVCAAPFYSFPVVNHFKYLFF